MRDRTGKKLGETGIAFHQAERVLTSHFAGCGVGAPSMLRPSRPVRGENFFLASTLKGRVLEKLACMKFAK